MSLVGKGSQDDGCVYSAAGLFLPGHLKGGGTHILHSFLIGRDQGVLTAGIYKDLREGSWCLCPFFGRGVTQQGSEFFIADLIVVIEVDVDRLLGGFQQRLKLSFARSYGRTWASPSLCYT